MSSLFALDQSGRIVYVSEVARGLACNCRCVVCGEALLARQGTVREHHFAHASGREPCDANHESLLHRFAKQVIAESKGVVVPLNSPVRTALGLLAAETDSELLNLENISEEIQLGPIRPDLVAHTIEGVTLGIELAYTSFCEEDKVTQFAEMRLPALEIDISSFSPEGFDPEELRSFLLTRSGGKKWLWPNELPEESQPDLTPDAPFNPPPPVTAFTASRLPEEIVTISGRWVSIKQFPSGDIAVRVVRYDPDVVSLVKSIAKANYGWYSARWTSWNVPRWRAGNVRAALRQKSASVSIRVHDD